MKGIALSVAYREFRKTHVDGNLLRAVHASKDPTTFTVMFEDTAALLGLLAAFLGVLASQLTGIAAFDGSASIVIGLILMVVALLLAYESRGLLVGEGADPETIQSIRELAESDPAVEQIDPPLTMYLGPHEVLLNLDIQFRRDATAADVEAAVDRLEKAIRRKHPEIQRIFIEAESLAAGLKRPSSTAS